MLNCCDDCLTRLVTAVYRKKTGTVPTITRRVWDGSIDEAGNRLLSDKVCDDIIDESDPSISLVKG